MGATVNDSYVYFLDTRSRDGEFVRIGWSNDIARRVTQHINDGKVLLAVMPATKDIEGRIHRHFGDRLGRLAQGDLSTYRGPEVWAYVRWLIKHGYATLTVAEARHIGRPTWSSINPMKTGHPDMDDTGQGELFGLSPRDRVKHAASVAYHQSESDEWYTPSEVVEAARRTLGSIDLDPASCPAANAIVQATTYWSRQLDGLADNHAWEGNVWMNPPYNGLSERFVARLLRELDAGTVPAAVALLNANSMSSKWFAPVAQRANAMMVSTGRFRFKPGTEGQKFSSPSTGSVICYFGPRVDLFHAAFREFGYLIVHWDRLREIPLAKAV